MLCYNKIMDDNNQQGWLSQRPASFPPAQPADRPKPPPPPPPEITVRTMKSDLESLKQTGGAMPLPKTFTPPELKREVSPAGAPPPPLPPPAPSRITPSEFGEPKKMESPAKPASSVIEEEGRPAGILKKILVWSLGAVLAIGVGLAGYYFIYPALFPAQVPPPPPAITNQTPPAQNPVPAVPQAQLPPAFAPHQSLLKSADQNSAAKLSATDLNSLKTALQEEAKKLNPPGTLAELAMSNANGQIPASTALSALIPEISADTMKKLFQEDFTAALFYDANGVWPAYVLKLSSEASQVEAQTAVSGLESSKNLKNLFLADPGTSSASGFKTGQTSGVATRYLTYSKKGAGLNIAWSGDKLVVSTSFEGLKKILANLAQ